MLQSKCVEREERLMGQLNEVSGIGYGINIKINWDLENFTNIYTCGLSTLAKC